jgi:hypothetical protein
MEKEKEGGRKVVIEGGPNGELGGGASHAQEHERRE